MPDKSIYWYGYEPYLWETGTITHSGYTYKNGTKNKNNLYINVDSSEKYISRGWITQDKVDLSSANNIKGYVTTNGATNAFEFYLLSAKNLEPSSRIKSLLISDTAKLFDIDVSSLSSSLYPECECGNSGTGSTRQGYLWALWVE